MLRSHPALLRHRDGSTIVEFAIIALPLFLLISGFIEFGLIFFANSVLEGATNVGSRSGKTGYTEGGLSREDYIKQQVRELSGGFLDASLIQFSILSYSDFSAVNQPEDYNDSNNNGQYDTGETFIDTNGDGTWSADQGREGAGAPGEVTLYTVTYPWTLFTPGSAVLFGDNGGIFDITAVSTVRNEPSE